MLVLATLSSRFFEMRKQPIKPCRNRSADARVRVEKPHSAPHRRAGRRKRSGLKGPKLCCICNSVVRYAAALLLAQRFSTPSSRLSSLGTDAALCCASLRSWQLQWCDVMDSFRSVSTGLASDKHGDAAKIMGCDTFCFEASTRR